MATASKPKPTYFSPWHPMIEYEFLCAATSANLETVREQLRLYISKRHGNGNLAMRCPKAGNRRLRCDYQAIFVAKKKAVFAISGREHNHPHPMNIPPDNEDEEEGTSSSSSIAVQNDNDQDDYMDEDEENLSIDEEEEEPVEEEADGWLANEQKLVKVERQRLLAHIKNGQQLAATCNENKLEEMGRYYRCRQANCPYRAIFLSDDSNLYVFNEHNH